MKHTISIAAQIPVYATVEVEAKTAEDALERVQAESKESADGFASAIMDQLEFGLVGHIANLLPPAEHMEIEPGSPRTVRR